MTRALHLAAAIAWAISPEWLGTILTIANREGAGPEAVSAELGRPLENTHAVERRGDIAVIPVHGPIFRRANLFSQVSGATSVQVLATDLHMALDAEEIKAVVLDVDSPGGEANGISELAAMIFAARGRKPIYAYVGGTGASAAYWIAAACDKILVNDTACVGSIGVVRAMPNPAASSARDIEIVSSVSPNKRPDVTTKDGRAVVQAEVDALADVFVGAVARYRGVSPETVVERFGRGGCLIGAAAVDAGMADGLSSFEAVLASLAEPTTSTPGGMTATAPETRPMAKPAASLPARTLAAEDDMPPASEPAGEPDGDEPKGPAFAEGDAVMVGERPAEVTEVRNGPHYAVTFTDEQGGAFQWASEDELEAAGSEAQEDGEEPTAEDDEDGKDKALRSARAEIRALKAKLAGKTSAQRRATSTAIAERALADRRVTPAALPHLRALATAIGANPRAHVALESFVSALPRIPAATSVRMPPKQDANDTPAHLKWAGRDFSTLTMAEKESLYAEAPELFAQMRSASRPPAA